jgi:putative nucleotidyltransferase with HDIG domain
MKREGFMTATVQKQSLMDMRLRDLKKFVTDLPTLPVIFQELFKCMQDPDVQVSELAEIIVRDQALTAKILKLVNSAFYGRAGQVTTINRAVVIMGFQTVRSAALAISVFDYFKDMRTDGRVFNLHGFWRHSIGVSCLAKQASIMLKKGEPEEAFVAGLLHDIGKLVMLRHFPADIEDLTQAAAEQHLTWRMGEKMLFPISHDSIADDLFRSWNFPASVVEAVAFHHQPEHACRHAELASLIHLADFFSYHMDCGCPGGVGARTHAQEAAQIVGLTPDIANEILVRAEDEFSESLEILKLLD